MKTIHVQTWAEFKSLIASKSAAFQKYDGNYSPTETRNELFIIEPGVEWVYGMVKTTEGGLSQAQQDELDDYNNNFASLANKPIYQANNPFAGKTIGKYKIFQRVHGFTLSFAISEATKTASFTIPYPICKITGVEIVDPVSGDICDFKVHDDDAGTYSGISDYMLNQFGYSVNMPDGQLYKRDSNYDADLFYGMKIKIPFTRLDDSAVRTVRFNAILHELKV